MKNRIKALVAGAALLLPVAVTLAAGVALPGDRGPPNMGGGGGPGGPGGAGAPGGGGNGGGMGGPGGPPREQHPAPTVSIDLAMKATLAIAAACKQYPMALAVVDSEGVPKIIYTPDGSEAWHGYSAVRKAYTAVTFKTDTSKVVPKAKTDQETMDKFKSDPNLQAQSGGIVLMAGDKLLGAIGVSGAEPGGHDEECAMVGLAKIKADLK